VTYSELYESVSGKLRLAMVDYEAILVRWDIRYRMGKDKRLEILPLVPTTEWMVTELEALERLLTDVALREEKLRTLARLSPMEPVQPLEKLLTLDAIERFWCLASSVRRVLQDGFSGQPRTSLRANRRAANQ
jgi:hypothetical protein